MAKLKFRDCPLLDRRLSPPAAAADAGWYFGTPWPDWPEVGPYPTKKERNEARDSFVRNWVGNFPPHKVCTDPDDRRKARKAAVKQ
jgi:hypothetical protein